MEKTSVSGDKRMISRLSLLRIAADSNLNGMLIYLAAWGLILAVICMADGITPLILLFSVIFIDICIVAIFVHASFRVKCAWNTIKLLNRLILNTSNFRCLKGKTLEFRNGGWEYSDAEWYVRVNADSACILHEPELCLSLPARHVKYSLYDDFSKMRMYAKTKRLDRYSFQSKDGKLITVQVDRAESLLSWIARHGGRTKMY